MSKREVFYQGKILTFAKEVEPDGEIYDIIEHNGAVVMLPIDEEGNVFFVTQTRRAVRKKLLELPAGSLETGEDIELCAQRELREEIGHRSDDLTRLNSFYTAPSFCTEELHLFLAKNLVKDPLPMDEHEDIEVVKIPLEKALEMCMAGEIVDAKTLIGIYYLALTQKKV
ncbi:MAG: ADP-ribose pyrophosphatase [Chlamydiia bacterium]|nr:ADP-ribose pyrophosphatase [Chlamydiia bacterium]MCH9615656.1 ADP-ribose pyrophosphatase [Chlamydiia bacterium]MCH9628941.1 ADP-ribose pyrophosphatase [Chlamydiia bacterium]